MVKYPQVELQDHFLVLVNITLIILIVFKTTFHFFKICADLADFFLEKKSYFRENLCVLHPSLFPSHL